MPSQIMTPSERKKYFRRKKKTKLSEKDIKGIRKMAKAGNKQKNIAKLYRISPGHVSRILSGDLWSHV